MLRGFKLLVALLLLGFVLISPVATVFAADDTNSGNLTPNPTLTPQQVASALTTLGQNTNDSNIQQLLQKLNSQLSSGDNAGASSTILQLKADSNNPNMSASMKALLQSISSGQNGLTLDPQLLSSLLGANTPTANGVPSNLRNESPSRIPVDLNTLANLLQYVDPTLASSLLGEAGQPTQSVGQKSIPSITPPGINLNKIGLPTISTPSFGSVGGVSLPSVNPLDFAFPLLFAAAIIGAFLSRHRFMRLLGSQTVPAMGEVGELEADLVLAPNTPKERVIAIFRKSVRLMRGRGVPKFRHETHREFSSKCSERPEGEHIGTISSLYEKAVFSGAEVTPSDATLAEREGESVEKTH
jgi:uncharacterized protein YneF (UPF0154 family)